MSVEKRYTTAPESYDGFGTKTVGVVGYDRGYDVRLVEIRKDHLGWHEGRYASGGNPCLTESKWKQLVKAGIATETNGGKK